MGKIEGTIRQRKMGFADEFTYTFKSKSIATLLNKYSLTYRQGFNAKDIERAYFESYQEVNEGKAVDVLAVFEEKINNILADKK